MAIINGTFGNDILNGTEGDDTLNGGSGNDLLGGGAGSDLLEGDGVGWGGNDTLNGNEGNDTLNGGSGNDRLNGHAGNDLLKGDDGVGLGGNDELYGGEGDDTLYGGEGIDYVYGNEGNDLQYGNAGNDFVFGFGGNDTLYGNEGNDFVFGYQGNDLANGNQGNDTLKGDEGNDTLYGGKDNDSINGNADNDSVNGNLGNDTVYGGQGNDNIHGGKGNDKLFGDNGVDWLHGDLGNDTMTGGTDLDYFYFTGTHDNDVITDFVSGTDKLYLVELGFDSVAEALAAYNAASGVLTTSGGTITLNSKPALATGDVILLNNNIDKDGGIIGSGSSGGASSSLAARVTVSTFKIELSGTPLNNYQVDMTQAAAGNVVTENGSAVTLTQTGAYTQGNVTELDASAVGGSKNLTVIIDSDMSGTLDTFTNPAGGTSTLILKDADNYATQSLTNFNTVATSMADGTYTLAASNITGKTLAFTGDAGDTLNVTMVQANAATADFTDVTSTGFDVVNLTLTDDGDFSAFTTADNIEFFDRITISGNADTTINLGAYTDNVSDIRVVIGTAAVGWADDTVTLTNFVSDADGGANDFDILDVSVLDLGGINYLGEFAGTVATDAALDAGDNGNTGDGYGVAYDTVNELLVFDLNDDGAFGAGDFSISLVGVTDLTAGTDLIIA